MDDEKTHVVSARSLNKTLRAGVARAEVLEPRLADLVRPILEGAGETAARNFRAKVTNHLAASAFRRDVEHMAALGRDGLRAIFPSLVLTAGAGRDHSGSNGTMIALKPLPEEADALAAPEGVDPGTMHVTLAYLGQYDGDLDELADVFSDVVREHAALEGRVGGIGSFDDNGNGYPAILLPSVPGLIELRLAVTQALVDAGFDYGREHGYLPHLTVSYEDSDMVFPSEGMGQKLHFDDLWVVRGDTDVRQLPLGGTKPVTAAAGSPEGPIEPPPPTDQTKIVDEVEREIANPTPAPGLVRRIAESVGVEEIEVRTAASLAGLDRALAEAEQRANEALGPVANAATWTPPLPDELIDVDQLVSTLRGKTDPVREAVVRSTMTPTLEGLGIGFDTNHHLIDKVLSQAGSQIVNIAVTTQMNVMRIIDASQREGLSIPDTATAIRAGMKEASDVRATLIARTEIVGAVNGGSLAATQIVEDTTGLSYLKEWRTAPGAKYPRHELYEGLDGQTTTLDGVFDVGGDQLQFPGDPGGSPEEICNCRCALVYVESERAARAEREPDLSTVLDRGAAEPVVPERPVDTVSVGAGPRVRSETLAKVENLHLDEWPTPLGPVAKSILGDARSTEELYLHDGIWDPAREQHHREIVDAYFRGKTAPAVEDRFAYFAAGGGASGKSGIKFVRGGHEYTAAQLGERADTILINPDDVKSMIPEYDKIRLAGDPSAASVVHEESSAVAKLIQAKAENDGYSIVLDSTGSTSKFGAKLTKAIDDGYHVQVSMVSIPTNEAIERSINRGETQGRFLAMKTLKEAHSGASAELEKWKDMKGIESWRLYDNQHGLELVASGGGGSVKIVDQAKWDAIVAKKAEASAETTVGVTPFRPEDNPVGFFASPKAAAFEADLEPTAKEYGVTITRSDKVTGVWQGETEPSYAVLAHDGEEGVSKFAEAMRSKYDQDGVMIFAPGYPPDATEIEFSISGLDAQAAIGRLSEFGIDGATVADGKLVIVGDEGDASKVRALMKVLGGRLSSRRGTLSFVERP